VANGDCTADPNLGYCSPGEICVECLEDDDCASGSEVCEGFECVPSGAGGSGGGATGGSGGGATGGSGGGATGGSGGNGGN
jgi:hypothetical protein